MANPFDINEPVNQGDDMVINLNDGTQQIGSPAELQAAIDNDTAVSAVETGVEAAADAPVEAPAEVTAPAEQSQASIDNQGAAEPVVPEAPAEEAKA